MSLKKIELIKGWCNKGDEDILAAEIILTANLVLYDIAAFHAQQGAEKYVKAFITYTEKLPPKIHDLRELISIASNFILLLKTYGSRIVNQVCNPFALSR